jgi:hypothetical protein
MPRRFWSVAGTLNPSEPGIVAHAEIVPVSASRGVDADADLGDVLAGHVCPLD